MVAPAFVFLCGEVCKKIMRYSIIYFSGFTQQFNAEIVSDVYNV